MAVASSSRFHSSVTEVCGIREAAIRRTHLRDVAHAELGCVRRPRAVLVHDVLLLATSERRIAIDEPAAVSRVQLMLRMSPTEMPALCSKVEGNSSNCALATSHSSATPVRRQAARRPSRRTGVDTSYEKRRVHAERKGRRSNSSA